MVVLRLLSVAIALLLASDISLPYRHDGASGLCVADQSAMCQVHTGAYVSLLTPWRNQLYRLPPKKDYHVYITRSIYHYAYARQTKVNWKKETKNKQEEKEKERKEKKAKKENEKGKEIKKRQEKQEKARQEEEARKGK